MVTLSEDCNLHTTFQAKGARNNHHLSSQTNEDNGNLIQTKSISIELIPNPKRLVKNGLFENKGFVVARFPLAKN